MANVNDGARFLVFGATGWIGGIVFQMLRERGLPVYASRARLEDRAAILRDLEEFRPTRIINCAGKTGRPNVDWCEEHRAETVRANVIGTLNLCDTALDAGGLHVTNFATGCIYQYDGDHPAGSGRGFSERDAPNFDGSFYSMTKGLTEKLLAVYPNVLTLRLRMPLSDDLHPRSFLTKILGYARVVDIPNSVTVLHDLLPVALDMALRGLTGVYNFVNPGVISHNELLQLYKQYIDPSLAWVNFTEEEQRAVVKAPRSNNELDVSKLLALYPAIPPAKEAAVSLMLRMRASLHKTK
eukprot:m51a1_g5114 putative nad dependent epimerase (297) ;mRNA; f:349050-350429